MEQTKKTGTLRALLLAISAFAMLLTGVFVATSASATPEASNGCPEDFALMADGTSCFQLAQTQTTSTAPTCASGTLTPSGTHCYLPAVVTPQTRTDVVANVGTTTYSCPAGSTGSGSGAALTCSQSVPTSSTVANTSNTTYACPAGTTGSGSGAALTCSQTVPTSSTVANVATTTYACPAPSTGAPTAANPTCATVTNSTVAPTCNPTTQVAVIGGCKMIVGATNTGNVTPQGTCPAGEVATTTPTTTGVHVKCFPIMPATYCAAGVYNAPVAGQCNVAGTGTVAATATTTYSCPAGSTASGSGAATVCTVAGTAQQPVASTSTTSYSCPAGASASGSGAATVCTVAGTASQSVASLSNTSYACPAGFTAAGSGASTTCSKTVAIDPLITCKSGASPSAAGAGQYVCIVGPASVDSGTVPYCAKGVLSTDKTKCILAIGGKTSVAPAFTG